MKKEETLSRRKFIGTGLVAAGAGAAIIGSGCRVFSKPSCYQPAEQSDQESNMNKILLAYGSKCGSTAAIAEFIYQTLSNMKTQDGKTIPVDLLPVQQVKSLVDYGAVILGTALRFEAPISDTSHFVKKFNAELQTIPLSLFSVGVYMRENTPEMRTKTLGFLEPVLKTLPQPITTGLFAGVVDYEKMAPFWRFLVSKDSAGFMREGDWRDWDAIQAWAGETGAAMFDHIKSV